MRNSAYALNLFKSDLVNGTIVYDNSTEVFNTLQVGKVGGFDYSEVADMNNMLRDEGKLTPVGQIFASPGHYRDGSSTYVQL
jgi:hypothetical protein